MRLHRPRTLGSFASFSVGRPPGAVFAVLACIAGAATVRAASEPSPCRNEVAAATSTMKGLPAAIRPRVDRGIRTAWALVRFHRSGEALPKLDALVALLDGPRGERLEDSARSDLTKAIQTLRSCLAASPPAPLAAITIQAFAEDGGPEGHPGTPLREGVHVDVEGIRIGRTGPDGRLHANVPSGTIEIRAAEYPSSVGDMAVTLLPGESTTISIVLAEGKEPSEDSDLLLEEAPDDLLPADARSLTLAFIQDEARVSIESIEAIELSDVPGEAGDNLKEFFSVANGVIHATDPAAVYARLAARSRIGRTLSLAATAVDSEGRFHYGDVRFHLGRFKLAVTLAPPPSNPALPVANIPVRVSVIGSDIVMRRVSDANGRFELESLPDATVAFDAHTIASDVHYYADATLTMCAERSVRLLMRTVDDLVARTPALIIDSGPPACPPVPRASLPLRSGHRPALHP